MSVLTPFIWILFISPVLILAYFNSKEKDFRYVMYFIVYFLGDMLLQYFGRTVIKPEIIGLKFNWSGKFLSLFLALLIIFSVSKNERTQIGFTLKKNDIKSLNFGILVFICFTLFDIIFKLILFPKGGGFDLETFIFQATMPGLTEEIMFRGISLWLLNKAFVPKWNYRGINLGWSFIIVTLLFGASHGIVLDPEHHLKFDVITIFYLVLISSFSLGILRVFSGNLLYSITGHNVINLVNAIIRIL